MDIFPVTPKTTSTLAREIRKGLKKIGAVSVSQNYKGTGSRAHKRQLWCRFDNGAVIDLWIKDDMVKLGGVVWNGGKGPRYNVRYLSTIENTAVATVKAVKIWKDGE